MTEPDPVSGMLATMCNDVDVRDDPSGGKGQSRGLRETNKTTQGTALSVSSI